MHDVNRQAVTKLQTRSNVKVRQNKQKHGQGTAYRVLICNKLAASES